MSERSVAVCADRESTGHARKSAANTRIVLMFFCIFIIGIGKERDYLN